MNENRKAAFPDGAAEKEIVYSRVVKAGKRIYYLDVKRSRKNELFLSITESKKIPAAAPGIAGEEPSFTFEKHKIFLYREDMQKFAEALEQVMDYIRADGMPEEDGSAAPHCPGSGVAEAYLSPAFRESPAAGAGAAAPKEEAGSVSDLDFEVKF